MIANNACVLVIDDTPANLSLLNQLLRTHYRVKLANGGARGLELAVSARPDLILLDVMMPDMDGYEVCRRLKADPVTAGIPVIFLTAKAGADDEEFGLEVGAVDFIRKPIAPSVVLARVRNHLQIRTWQTFLEDKSAWLEREVERRVNEVLRLQEASIRVMVSLAEFRDECTGNHIRRTQDYVRLLADYLSREERDREFLSPEHIDQIAKAAPLHDIGKIAIPDYILLKQGRHTPEEFAIMKTHSVKGESMLLRSQHELGEENLMLLYAAQIARSHHERWDGTGYPDGLAGEEIPLPARLMAVADVYDALRSRRPYKRAFDHAEAVEVLRAGRASHFDPLLIDAFFALESDFADIAIKLADE
ncbi:two-component system response regulator [Dechloromonas sp. HYN0024]|uniref:response regulator n=1 Tax=Dechloromonas sp. HYN0024 TaxID=2231055 RepID=UPI000E4512C9|nr:two-component system response regulator [Dechloromonas sp. HYN0024]AXS80788.1 two-component system response regulator [Dechloromonas sp. HYN0024]